MPNLRYQRLCCQWVQCIVIGCIDLWETSYT